MVTEMTVEEYQCSKGRLAEMASRLGMEKIENDGRAYTVICFALLDRIEKLEKDAEYALRRAEYAEGLARHNAEVHLRSVERMTKLEQRIQDLETGETVPASKESWITTRLRDLWGRVEKLEGKGKPHPHWTDMPR